MIGERKITASGHPYVEYAAGSVGWGLIQLDFLLHNISNDVDKKVKRYSLFNDLRYHWMISDAFFEGITLENFTNNIRTQLAFQGGAPVNVQAAWTLRNGEDGDFHLDLVEDSYKVSSL